MGSEYVAYYYCEVISVTALLMNSGSTLSYNCNTAIVHPARGEPLMRQNQP